MGTYFTPDSKMYRDRMPRTMEEAFGPNARLTVEQPHVAPPTAKGFAVSIGVALFIGYLALVLSR